MARDKHRGARSELIACAWLLDQGYEVFRNVSPHGSSDVVAIKGATVLKIDIKTAIAGKPVLKPSQISEGIKALHVFADGSCEIIEDTRAKKSIPCRRCSTPFTPEHRQFFCSADCREMALAERNEARKHPRTTLEQRNERQRIYRRRYRRLDRNLYSVRQ